MLIKLGDRGSDITDLQDLLRDAGYKIVADGKFGSATEKAVKQFQIEHGLVPDGIIGPATYAKLSQITGQKKTFYLKDNNDFFVISPESKTKLATSKDTAINQVVNSINNYGSLVSILSKVLMIEEASAHAVIATESAGEAFKDQKMVIRFENHLFWKYWGKYHKTAFNKLFRFNQITTPWTEHKFMFSNEWEDFHGDNDKEWIVFETAKDLDRDAAIKSTSFGAPQLLGSHYNDIGYSNPTEMFEAFKTSDRAQIIGLFDFIQNDPDLLTSLQEKDWVNVAYHYNGSGQVEIYSSWLKKRYDIATSALALLTTNGLV